MLKTWLAPTTCDRGGIYTVKQLTRMQDAGSVAILELVPAVIRKKVGFVFLDRLSKKIPPTTTTSEQPASKPVLPDEKVNL